MAVTRLCSIPRCSKRAVARGWCPAHYYRWHAHGDPLAGRIQVGEPAAYLADKVFTYQGDDCLRWPYGGTAAGYGLVCVPGVSERYVHIIVCERTNGPRPTPKHEAAHSCGHEGCVNPRHIRWATSAQNKADMLEHGTRIRGAMHPGAKLTEDAVRRIRALRATALSQRSVAQMFGVSRGTIDRIDRGILWAWLDAPTRPQSGS